MGLLFIVIAFLGGFFLNGILTLLVDAIEWLIAICIFSWRYLWNKL